MPSGGQWSAGEVASKLRGSDVVHLILAVTDLAHMHAFMGLVGELRCGVTRSDEEGEYTP